MDKLTLEDSFRELIKQRKWYVNSLRSPIQAKYDKRKKLLDLPEDVITVLSVQAAKEGKSAKAFMEGLLISAANDLEDITTYTFLSKNQPEGHVMVSEAEQKAFEQKYGLS